MAAIERMHNFSKVSCFSTESLGKKDGRVKPLSWPFILQNVSKIEPSFDSKFRKNCPRFWNKLLLCWRKENLVTWTSQKGCPGFMLRTCGFRVTVRRGIFSDGWLNSYFIYHPFSRIKHRLLNINRLIILILLAIYINQLVNSCLTLILIIYQYLHTYNLHILLRRSIYKTVNHCLYSLASELQF